MKKCATVLAVLSMILGGCQPSEPSLEAGQYFEARVVVDSPTAGAVATRMLCSVPPGYKPGYPMPLLLAMHGYGGNAQAFFEVFKPVADSLGMVLAVPQGEKPLGGVHWAWGGADEDIVQASIDLVSRKVLIHPRLVFATGFSQGGALCYRLAARYPLRFKGIAPLGAPFLENYFTAANRQQLGHLRVWIGMGREDDLLADSQAAFSTLESYCQASHLELFDNIGHGLPEPKQQVLTAAISWLMEED